MSDTLPERLPVAEARTIVKSLLVPRPLRYWTDFLVSTAVGWGAFVAALRVEPVWSPVLCVVASLALYRALIFIHELAHLRKGTFGAFRFVWNLLCGIPLFVPSFTYHGVHNGHHKRAVYGTPADGEYVPFGAQAPYHIITYLLLVFVLPLAFAARFLILTPVSFLHPALRRLAWERASSLTIDLAYRRMPVGQASPGPAWRLQETATMIWAITVTALVATGVVGWSVILVWYIVTVVIVLLNSLRTLAAHAYRNADDRPMTLEEQFVDSVDVPGVPWVTALWAPVGLRFHATHHLFPSMPYHALPEAYRRLMSELPDTRVYEMATRTSLFDALRRLWAEARDSSAERAARPAMMADSATGGDGGTRAA
ncbi:MAG: fatty acid desaturase [Planctomycetes bacterium]|nr:fatty acid desaturase [Planctomycetota bacterium]